MMAFPFCCQHLGGRALLEGSTSAIELFGTPAVFAAVRLLALGTFVAAIL